MASKEDKDRELRSKALALGLLGYVPATVGAGAATRLLQGKGAKVVFSGPKISETAAERFPMKAFGKNPNIEFIKDVMPSSGRTVRLPVVVGKGRREAVPLPAAAHEFAHSAGGAIQKITNAIKGALFTRPAMKVPGTNMIVRSPAISPAHIPLLIAAATPRNKDEKGVVEFVKKHPAALAAALAAVPMASEAHASLKGLRAIKKIYGSRAAWQSAGPLARTFGATAASFLPAIAMIWGTSKIRDILQGRREREKRAGDLTNLVNLPTTMPTRYGRIVEIDPIIVGKKLSPSEKKYTEIS